MKTPFWWQNASVIGSIIAITLLPLSLLFFIAGIIRKIITKQVVLHGKFVICVGNITAGGTGKTPLCILIGEILKAQNIPFAFVSKGYGRSSSGFYEVMQYHSAQEVGDEPLLLSKHGKTFVFSNPSDILKIQETILICDDGLQNPSFKKDLSIICVGSNGIGRKILIPSGAMRESFQSAINKSHAVVIIGKQNPDLPTHNLQSFNIIPKYACTLPKQKIIAFSGLGNNLKFKQALQNEGFDLVHFYGFADHHKCSNSEIAKMMSYNLPIITTEKDFIKLSEQFTKKIHIFQMQYQHNDAFSHFILQNILIKKI